MPNSYIPLHSLVSFKLSKPESLDVDSIVLFNGQNRVEQLQYSNSFNADYLSTTCGKNYLQIKFYSQGKEIQKEIYHYIVLAAKPASVITPSPIRKTQHNRSSYTQGLEFLDDLLYESNGTYGSSNVLTLSTSGAPAGEQNNLPEQFFAEGLTILNNIVYQLTWRENTMFTYDLSLKNRKQRTYPFESEGWGLTNDGNHLLMSDGSHIIYRLDPNTLGVLGQIEVYHDRGPQDRLNELELINGKLYANIYQSDKIAVIDTASGQIETFIDLAGLLPVTDREQGTDVLNGIAYHPSSDEVFITGKKWPWMYIFTSNSLRDNVDN